MTDSQTNVAYTGIIAGWGPGTRIEIDSEIMLVQSVDTGNKIATVRRGWLNTTAVTHSSGSPIFIQPRIYEAEVMDLINDCLEDLFGRDLFVVDVEEIVYDGGRIGYAIPQDAIEILRVDGLKDSFSDYWEPIYDWLEMDNANTNDFASGKAIMLRAALPPGVFRVVYSKPFSRVDSMSDDLEVVAGLRPYMTDLPYYFAMNRLMVDLERHRSQIEAAQNHQRAQDTPPFLALRTGEWYQARYEDRIRTSRVHQAKEVKKVIGTGYGS